MPERKGEELVWMNPNNKVVDQDVATQVRIHRYNKKGDLIYEEWVDLDPIKH